MDQLLLDKTRQKEHCSKWVRVLTAIKLKVKDHCSSLGVPEVTVFLFFVLKNGRAMLTLVCMFRSFFGEGIFTVISGQGTKLVLSWVAVSEPQRVVGSLSHS